MLSGCGAAFFVTSFYAYVPILFPSKIEKMIGLCELAGGIGFLIGPICGSLLYNVGGYLTPFFVFGGLAISIAPVIYFFVEKLAKTKIADLSTSHIDKTDPNKEVPLLLDKLSEEAGMVQKSDDVKQAMKLNDAPAMSSDFQLVEDENTVGKNKKHEGEEEEERPLPDSRA
jgi:MFS family permease